MLHEWYFGFRKTVNTCIVWNELDRLKVNYFTVVLSTFLDWQTHNSKLNYVILSDNISWENMATWPCRSTHLCSLSAARFFVTSYGTQYGAIMLQFCLPLSHCSNEAKKQLRASRKFMMFYSTSLGAFSYTLNQTRWRKSSVWFIVNVSQI